VQFVGFFAFFQNWLILTDWQLEVSPPWRHRHSFLSHFLEIPSIEMFEQQNNQIPVLVEPLLADFVQI